MIVPEVFMRLLKPAPPTTAEPEWQRVLEFAGDGLYSVDLDGICTFANRAALSLFGFSAAAQVIGQDMHALMHHTRADGAPYSAGDCPLHRAFTTHAPIRLERETLWRSDRTPFWAECCSSPIYREGRLIGAVVTVKDVTAQKQSEETLRHSETTFRAVVERSPDAVAIVRCNQLLYQNARFLKQFGYTEEELLRRSILELFHVEDRDFVQKRLQGAEAGQPGFEAHEVRSLHRDGRAAITEMSALPVPFQGAPATMIVLRDNTERKQAQAQVLLSDRMASVGMLAAGVAHEINNPMTYVSANLNYAFGELKKLRSQLSTNGTDLKTQSDFLAALKKIDEVQQSLKDATEGTVRVTAIVQSLKAFSRADQETQGVIDLQKVMDFSIDMAFNEIRHRARLVKQYGGRADTLGNEARLGQVFLNLLINAAQAIPEGNSSNNQITVRIYSGNQKVTVEVSDTGAGMTKEHMARLFTPFFTTKPVGHGTGLGLAICQGIVQAHGGEIAVDSQVGQGTTFRVSLPEAPANAARYRPKEMVAPPPAPRRRIMVIDDEPMIGTAIRRALSSKHDVVTLTQGAQALTRLKTGEAFDVILCDIMMPQMSGMDFHAELAKLDAALVSKTIYMSGGAFTPKAHEFVRQLEKHRLLEKPVEASVLLLAVEEIAKHASSG